MDRSQTRQLANWMMDEGDVIIRVDIYTSGPVVTIKKAGGSLRTFKWEDGIGWCLSE